MNKKRKTGCKLILPDGIAEELDDYCKYKSIFRKPALEYFNYAYIISTITLHYINHGFCHTGTDGEHNITYEGCPLNQRLLALVIGVNNGTINKMLKNLIRMGIITRHGVYTPGEKSFCYKLAESPEQFISSIPLPGYSSIPEKIFIRHERVTRENTYAIKLYKSALQNITLEIAPDNEFYPYVSDLSGDVKHSSPTFSPFFSYIPFSLSSIPPTYSSPMMGGNENKAIELNTTNISTTLKNNIYGEKILKYTTGHPVNPYVLSLQAIADGEWFVLRPDEDSRVHTNLTNLKREFRQFLRYYGKPLIELDIRNSQPLLASVLIMDYWMQKGKMIPKDVIQYLRDCEAGEFYDYFMILNNIKSENRQQFKVRMFGEVFFSRVSKRCTTLKKQFIAKYPNVYKAICDIKGGYGSKTYNQFAIMLQRKEASIIFDTVNIGLLKDGIPAFNIFDSILCLEEHKEIVRERLISAFSALNITPTINYKEYTSIT